MPFLGRGDSPPASPVDVYVTTYLDRLLHVDDKEYAFSVGWVGCQHWIGRREGGKEGRSEGQKEGGGIPSR